MKRKFLITFITILNLMLINSVYSESKLDTVVSMQIDSPVMYINGEQSEIDKGQGTTPVIKNGRTLVPIRAIIEAFGGSVGWEQSTKTVTLNMSDDTISLIIDNNTAYLNDSVYKLDTAPCIINERTMLPIRFIAEGFNLGVAWEPSDRTVTVIRQEDDENDFKEILAMVPEYSGNPYVTLNNNKPFFEDYEIISGDFEYYCENDELDRCNVCMASLSKELMPTEKRESISSVKPTGWKNVSYDIVSGGYIYNRCHLIGFQLTGENTNARNLITGTRYLNVDGMLPFENEVKEYIEKTGNSVVYRVTPVFDENDLVADGVLMESYSVEDNGKGISFCVYCYNVQPGITINYADGTSFKNDEVTELKQEQKGVGYVINKNTKKFHYPSCASAKKIKDENREVSSLSSSELKAQGYSPCGNCNAK